MVRMFITQVNINFFCTKATNNISLNLFLQLQEFQTYTSAKTYTQTIFQVTTKAIFNFAGVAVVPQTFQNTTLERMKATGEI